MKLYFTLTLILASSILYAQNYRCIQPDSTGWYTNGSNYLRAVRIDSTRLAAGLQEVNYPFRSPRGNRNAVPAAFMDTTGGSWLGRKILLWTDGRTGFLNAANDTVIIRTAAQPGDNWVFYDDASPVRYVATLTSVSWRQLWPGTFDSVKEIHLQCQNNGVDQSSFKNDYLLLLSKNHGLVLAFDFWNFPYPYYNTTPPAGPLDYFLSLNLPTDTGKAFFRKINFNNLTYRQAYGWQSGDVYQYNTNYSFQGPITEDYRTDSIISRTETVAALIFVRQKTRAWREVVPGSNLQQVQVETAIDTVKILTPDSLIVRFDKLPEEWYTPWLFYYGPLASSLNSPTCDALVAIAYNTSFIRSDGKLDFGETVGNSHCGKTFRYRTGRGLESYAECIDPTWGGYGADLVYCKTGSQPCGQRNTLSVSSGRVSGFSISVYPNPASDRLYLRCEVAASAISTELADLSGRVLRRVDWRQSANLDLSGLAAGMYLLRNGVEGVSETKLIRVE